MKPTGALICLLLCAAALLFNDGCKKEETSPVEPQGGGGNGGTGTVTDSLRFVALQAFNSFADGLDYGTPAAYTKILEYFRSHPETYETSDTTGPRSAWARFKDGRIFIVSDDTETSPDTSTFSQTQLNRLRRPTGPSDNLPSNSSARFLNALGPAFDPLVGVGGQGTVDDLRDWFSSAGYNIPTSGDASVEGLKRVQGDGVFYLSSHGSWGEARGNQTAYGVWTTDEVTPANDAKFSADLNSNPPRLCWYRALDNNSIFGQNRRVHYAITAQFVQDYMNFGTNSLVFFNACRTDAPENQEFKAACIAKHAGVYVGWSNNINCWTALKSARFFLDRLIGANQESPVESPRQRPFEITYVLEDMLLRHKDVHSTERGPTKLSATPLYGYGGEPTLIAPTLQVATPPWIPGVDVNVLIDGSFGDDPRPNGTVLLGNSPLTIASWTPSRIECPPPAGGGNLVVKVRGIKSNPIQLTEWHAQFTLTYRGPGSLQHRIVLNLNFWADIHRWRVLPNKPANFWIQRFPYVMGSSSCQFESSGVYRSNIDTNIVYERWSNALTPQLSRSFLDPAFFGLTGLIDSVGRETRLDVKFRGEFTRFVGGIGTSQEYFTPPAELTELRVQLTSGYGFPQGSLPYASGDYKGTMVWNTIPCQYPPDPSGGW